MSFDQDPSEQANISAADFAQMCDEMKMLQSQAIALHQVAAALGFKAGDDVTRAPWAVVGLVRQRAELLAALEQFATWGRMQHKAQSKGCHATFDMMALKDEIDLAEAAIAGVKGGA